MEHQDIGGHTSIHDGDTADSLGLTGAPIEGPTHLSQFDPLAHAVWGDEWFATGCLSAHFRTMVVEGEEVTASLTRDGASPTLARITAAKPDGAEVLAGTASIGTADQTELGARLARIQLEATFTALRGLVAEIEVTGEPRRVYSNFIGGTFTLPVRLKVPMLVKNESESVSSFVASSAPSLMKVLDPLL